MLLAEKFLLLSSDENDEHYTASVFAIQDYLVATNDINVQFAALVTVSLFVHH